MKVDYTNPKDDQTYVVDLSKLQIIPFTSESLKQITEMLEPEQIGNVMIAVAEFMYGDKKPVLNTKVENGMFERLISEITRLGFSHFKRTKNLKNNNVAFSVKEQTGQKKIFQNTRSEIIDNTTKDEPLTSDLTIDPVLEEDFDKQNNNSQTLDEFFEGHIDGVMRNRDWSNFSQEYPDAERIRYFSNIGIITAQTLYNIKRNNLLNPTSCAN